MFELPPPPAIIEPAPAELREFADPRRFRRELLGTTKEATIPGLMAYPAGGGGSYGYTQLASRMWGEWTTSAVHDSTSGTSVTTSSITPTAGTENFYQVMCRYSAGTATDLTLSDSIGSAYDAVGAAVIQGTIIQKVFKLRSTTTTARTLTAAVVGSGITSLGIAINRCTVRNPSGVTLVSTLVESPKAAAATLSATSTGYTDIITFACASSASGITDSSGKLTRIFNGGWSNGSNGRASIFINTTPFDYASGRQLASTGAGNMSALIVHMYFRVNRSAARPVATLTDQQFTASGTGTTKNFTLAIGKAYTDRVIVVAIHFDPDSVGSSMNFNNAYINSDTNDIGINPLHVFPFSNPVPRNLIYWFVPTGTTVPLTITAGANSTKIALTVWSLRGCRYAVHTSMQEDAETAAVTVFDPPSITVKAGGIGLASMMRRTGGVPPANPTVWAPSGWVADAADLGPPSSANGALSSAKRSNTTSSDASESVTATFSVSTSNGGSLMAGAFGP